MKVRSDQGCFLVLGCLSAAVSVAGVGCGGDLGDEVRDLLDRVRDHGDHAGRGGGGGDVGGAGGGAGGAAGMAMGTGGAGGAGCEPPPPTGAPPRLIGPLSGSLASSAKPAFHWIQAADSDATRIDVCRDRACRDVIEQQTVVGAPTIPVQGTSPLAPLPPGHVFWRAVSVRGGRPSSAFTPTWELFLPRRLTNVASALGTRFDADGDGFCDFVLDGKVLRGGPRGFDGSIPVPVATDADVSFVTWLAGGDLNGDGFSDVVRLDQHFGEMAPIGRFTINPFFGGPSAVTAGPPNAEVDIEGALYDASTAGDVNGDGYADLLVKTRFVIAAYYGGVAGLTTGSNPQVDTSQSFFTVDGDIDADNFSDAVSTSNGVARILVTPGSQAGFSTATHAVDTPPGQEPAVGLLKMLDANGDGFMDLAVTGSDGALRFYAGSALGLVAVPFQTLPSAAGQRLYAVAAGDFDGDGVADLVAIDGTAVFVYAGRGAAGFAETGTRLFTPEQSTIVPERGAIGDVNADGFDDLVTVNFASDPATGHFRTTAATVFLGGVGGLTVGSPPAQ